MKKTCLYEDYHKDRKLQKSIIRKKNFTYRHLLTILEKYNNRNNILDIGSGVGTIDFYLASKNNYVTSIELSQSAIQIAKENAKLLKVEKYINFIEGDFIKTKINIKFDLVTCSEVLEHLKEDQKALKKINSLLNKDGTLILSVPTVNSPLYKWGLLKDFDKEVGHLRRYNEKDLKQMLKDSSFRVIQITKREGIIRNSLFVYKIFNVIVRLANKFPVISDLITFIDDLSIPIFGESNIYIEAKKI